MKLNELTSRTYTERNRFYTDEINEYEYISEKNLTEDEFTTILNNAKVFVAGVYASYKLIKKQLTLNTGKKLYKHIIKLTLAY